MNPPAAKTGLPERHVLWKECGSYCLKYGPPLAYKSVEFLTMIGIFCSSCIMRDWMERGVRKIGIEPGMRYGWHSLRRQFATDLKHIPLSDLCALGGWKDPNTILKCYTQPDERTMREALNSRTRLAVNSR